MLKSTNNRFAYVVLGVSVRVSGEADKLMHHKFCLIDGTNARGALITGSLNWTYGVSFHIIKCTLIRRIL